MPLFRTGSKESGLRPDFPFVEILMSDHGSVVEVVDSFTFEPAQEIPNVANPAPSEPDRGGHGHEDGDADGLDMPE